MKPCFKPGLVISLALSLLCGNRSLAAESIFPESVVVEARYSDAPNWELGTIFTPTAPGTITHVRVFSLAEEFGDHQVRIWRNSDNTLVAGPYPWTFGGDEAWITRDIDDVAVQAGVGYTVSISAPEEGWYPANPQHFPNAGNNGQHLSYPAAAGVFSETPGNRPASAFGNAAYLRDIVFVPDLNAPVILVQGNNADIPDGTGTASESNHTQFGAAAVGSGSLEHSVTIRNTGGTALELSGTPRVMISGPHASDFAVSTQPSSPLAPGASTPFTIRFQPSAAGVRDALVVLTNSANPSNPFDFAIQGVGLGTGNLRIGNRSEGSTLGNINADAIFGNRFLSLRNMRLTQLHAKVREASGAYQCAIYSDNQGAADRLLQSTAEVTNPTNGWNAFTFIQPVNLTAATYYWLVIWSDAPDARVYADSGGVSRRGDYAYSSWPDPVSLDVAGPGLTFCLYGDGLPLDVTGPEMAVHGVNHPIPDGSVTPSAGNGTEFAGARVNGPGREMTYTISNAGTTALQLIGNPAVTVAGTHASEFGVETQPSASVPPGGSANFTLRFTPAGFGLREAVISIGRGDSPGDPFTFAVRGAGLGGGAGVLGNDSEGTAARNIDDAQIHGNRFLAPVDLRITELQAKVIELEGTFKCAVYSDNGGWADRLLRSTVEVLNATNGWNTFPLVAPLEVKGGEYYWLVIWSDTFGARVQFDPVGISYFGTYVYADAAGQWPDPISLTESSLSLDPPNRTYCIYAEGAPVGTSPGPEMDLRGNGKLIVSTDSTPLLADGTDFGSVDVSTGSKDQVFTIQNMGDAPLQLTLPIAITGPQSADFIVTSPPVSPVPPGGAATFTLRYDPIARGLSAATVALANNDPDESPYQFAVQGAGFASGRETIWPDTKTANEWVENTVYELGMIFQSSVPGKITHLRVYSVAREAGDHIARLWRNADDTVVGGPYTWNYGGDRAWITLDIPDVEIEAETEYTVAISTGSQVRNYPNVAADLLRAGNNGQHLSYPENAGVFTTVADQRPTSSFNGGNYLRDIIFVPAGVTIDLPDMEIRGNNTVISKGDQTPGTGDGTDFGSAAPGSANVEHAFTIANPGTAPLNLTSTPRVALSGPQAGDFIVGTQPATPVPPGGTATFTIRFAPTTNGVRNATVTILNDSDKNPYDFAITGTGAATQAQLRIVEVRTSSATDLILQWEGEGQQFQVERAAAVNGPYQAVGAPQTERVFTDRGALQSGARMFYRIRRL